MKKLSSVLSENMVKSSMSLANLQSFDELLKKANEINEPVPGKSLISKLHQQNVTPIAEDQIMQSYLKISDIIDCFSEVGKFYKENRNVDNRTNLSWHDEKIIKHLAGIRKYIDQLASYISIDHKSINVEIQLENDIFDNKKSLSTFIKASDEWKELRKLLNSDLTLRNQTLTVRCLGVSIVNKTKTFVKILP